MRHEDEYTRNDSLISTEVAPIQTSSIYTVFCRELREILFCDTAVEMQWRD
jgi:hypothetical protein